MEFNKPDPLNLSEGNISDKFKQFKEEINIYFIATKTMKESKEIQLARLKNLLGTDGLKLYNSIKDESVVETVENVMKTLEKHCVPKQNMTMSINLLFSRKQLPHENVDSFYTDLRNLIRCCKFEEQEEKILRVLIILGVNNKELQEKLLREDTSFNRVINFCKASELAEKNVRLVNNKGKTDQNNFEVDTVLNSKIAVDIAEFQRSCYLVIVDYYSRWIEALKISSKSSSVIISNLKEVFSRFGIPRTLIADNMPFNSIEFKQFSQEWNVTIITTSPYYPQSNGLVEKSVGIVKEMLKKCQETKQDLQLYLLNHRNSPISNLEVSPAQLLNSRQLRSKIPMREELLKPKLVEDSIYEKMIETQKAQKSFYDRKSLNREDSFTEGQEVWVQDVFNIGLQAQGEDDK